MSGPPPAPTAFYTATEVAQLLRCSPWWVKEQARKRRIPYCWIGGSYRFTDQHITEIARLCEVQPLNRTATAPTATGHRRTRPDNEPATVVQLVARPPRRTRQPGAA